MIDTTPARRPIPEPDADSAPYWQAAGEGRLSLPQCKACGKIAFPPRQICPGCNAHAMRWITLSGRGTVYSHCVMHERFVRGVNPPLAIGQIELEEQAGLRLVTNILGCAPEAVRIGMPVEAVFEEIAPGVRLPQFRPRESA